MTREQFIDAYLSLSPVAVTRTERGYRIGCHERVAVPCACGDDLCQGWAMVPAEEAGGYARRYSPHDTPKAGRGGRSSGRRRSDGVL